MAVVMIGVDPHRASHTGGLGSTLPGRNDQRPRRNRFFGAGSGGGKASEVGGGSLTWTI